MYWTVEKVVGALARALAVAGGLALLAVVAMTTLSVSMQALDFLGLEAVPGEIELVEFGIGFGVFAAMPYAQYVRSHARVDLFYRLFGKRGNAVLDLLADVVLLAVAWLIASRLYLGMLDKGAYGETSFILRIPVVWGYYGAFAACVIAVIVAVFCVLRSGRALIGREV